MRASWRPASPAAFAALLGGAALIRGGMVVHAALDPDEGQHLNAAWLVGRGQVPYRDYWDHHAPLFAYVMAPLTRWLNDRSAIYPVSRALMVATAGVALVIVFRLARRFSLPAARLAVLLLAFAPRFVIKTTEVRPDVPALVLWLAAVLALIRWREDDKAEWLWLAGAMLGAAVTLNLKAVHGVLAAAVVVAVAAHPSGAGQAGAGRTGAILGALGRMAAGLGAAPVLLVAWLLATGGPPAIRAAFDQLVVANARFVDFPRPGLDVGIGYTTVGLGLAGLLLAVRREGRTILRHPVHGPIGIPLVIISAMLLLPTTPGVAGHAWLPVLAGLAVYAGLALTALSGRPGSGAPRLRSSVAAVALVAALLVPGVYLTRIALNPALADQLRAMRRLLAESCPDEPVLDGNALAVFRPSAYRYRMLFNGVRSWVARGTVSAESLIDEIRESAPRLAHPDGRTRGVPEIDAFVAEHYLPGPDGVWLLGWTAPDSEKLPAGRLAIDAWAPGLYWLRLDPGVITTLDGFPVQPGPVTVSAGRHELAWRGGSGAIRLTAATCPERRALGAELRRG